MQIKDEVLALDFDIAIAMRTQKHDDEIQKTGAIRNAMAVNAGLAGKLNELVREDEW